MQEVYNYKTLAEWLTIHKNRVDEIMQRDGFCAGFRYDLAVRTNAFQCDTFSDGKIVFPNISLHRPTIKQQTYSEARANDELCFLDNPYVPGGQQEEYNPHTGCLKTNQSKKRNTDTRLGGQNQNGCTNSFRRDSYRSPRNRDDRDSSPDQNRQENNPRGQNGDDRRGNRNRNRNQDSRARDRACNHSSPQGQSSPKEGQRTPQRNKPRVPPPPLSPHGPSFEPQAATPDRETLQVTQAEPRAATWPSGVSCEMNVSTWESALSAARLLPKYQDVLDGFSHGFDQGIPPHGVADLPWYTPPNHSSALTAQDDIERNFQKEISAGQMYGPFTHEEVASRFPFFRTSPLGSVTNGDGSTCFLAARLTSLPKCIDTRSPNIYHFAFWLPLEYGTSSISYERSSAVLWFMARHLPDTSASSILDARSRAEYSSSKFSNR
ncbi:hypothetical protein PCANC_08958 [Puccinia coronata f. sp. avenae]|uniref:Uncharacterized protein n=1 Tax=Puccinia coronata f. sp. avenae TaxID=200324 RepID=A0A2N5T2F6_9BASI|nr:hypothetical protein PCANC_08958 [Puccinia coronata f. sp. avenae]